MTVTTGSLLTCCAVTYVRGCFLTTMSSKTEKRSHHKPRIGRPPKRKKTGRPLKLVPEYEITRLMAEGFTADYVCTRLGISKDLLYRRFKHLLDRGRALRDGDLQARQFAVAMSGCPSMLIWLGKNFLNERDKVEQTGPNPLTEILAELNKRSE